jgi:hypothetical protein
MSLQISIFKCQLVKHPHGIEVDEYGVGICFPDMRGERRERERERKHMVANVSASPPPIPWALFIGEVERTVYILFH